MPGVNELPESPIDAGLRRGKEWLKPYVDFAAEVAPITGDALAAEQFAKDASAIPAALNESPLKGAIQSGDAIISGLGVVPILGTGARAAKPVVKKLSTWHKERNAGLMESLVRKHGGSFEGGTSVAPDAEVLFAPDTGRFITRPPGSNDVVSFSRPPVVDELPTEAALDLPPYHIPNEAFRSPGDVSASAQTLLGRLDFFDNPDFTVNLGDKPKTLRELSNIGHKLTSQVGFTRNEALGADTSGTFTYRTFLAHNPDTILSGMPREAMQIALDLDAIRGTKSSVEAVLAHEIGHSMLYMRDKEGTLNALKTLGIVNLDEAQNQKLKQELFQNSVKTRIEHLGGDFDDEFIRAVKEATPEDILELFDFYDTRVSPQGFTGELPRIIQNIPIRDMEYFTYMSSERELWAEMLSTAMVNPAKAKADYPEAMRVFRQVLEDPIFKDLNIKAAPDTEAGFVSPAILPILMAGAALGIATDGESARQMDSPSQVFDNINR